MSNEKYAVETAALQATANVGPFGSQPLLSAKLIPGLKMFATPMGLFWQVGSLQGMIPLTNIRGLVFKEVQVEDKPPVKKSAKEVHA